MVALQVILENIRLTNDVTEIIIFTYFFSGLDELLDYLNYGKKLLEKYAGAKDISIKLID
ncbi:Uncharacterised protein [[Clostridium] sordellii]|uniref:hypothetical protein n=1 Tax=Paraclostridium sordellii TaxID=1505 RepID=UPI0005E737C7|nr:hypothetical protein [Paeniclostridium sordellii]CEQ20647.1 Uncharacterised protein [[Clostridium] sordellii] [Paeniclostridium sordellii]